MVAFILLSGIPTQLNSEIKALRINFLSKKTVFHGVGYIFGNAGCLAGGVEYITGGVNYIAIPVE